MPKLMFAWLGSGRARRRKVGSAGLHLDQAARAGLPVPPGAVLLDEFFRLALETELATANGQQISIPDPAVLHATIFDSVRLPRFERLVTLSPVSIDVVQQSQPALNALSPVDSSDVKAFCRALARAWSTCVADNAGSRCDVLVCESVAATCMGNAWSLAGSTVDTFQPLTTLRVDDDVTPDSLEVAALARLGGWQRPDASLPPYAQRLQMLLRGVRHSLGQANWLASWADDGRICWLVGLQKLDMSEPSDKQIEGHRPGIDLIDPSNGI